MRCFNHQASEAVAVCKHCGKGLCADCLVESRGAVSCRGLCEKQVAKFLYVIDRSTRSHRTAVTMYRALAVIFVLLMPACILLGVLIAMEGRFVKTREGFSLMVTAFSVSGICFLMAIICFWFAQALTKRSKHAEALSPPSADGSGRTG
jgi:hypothetical protein